MEKLAYQKQNGIVSAADYIAWAHRRLDLGDESPALFQVAALSADTNLFEVESYVQAALKELHLELPTLGAYESMKVLAQDIVSTDDADTIHRLARDMFMLASDLGYHSLSHWLTISDMQDRLQYDAVRPPYTEQDVLQQIKDAAQKATMNYTCPCCGYKTLDEEPPGTYDICTLCF